jgi:hypothetical protein
LGDVVEPRFPTWTKLSADDLPVDDLAGIALPLPGPGEEVVAALTKNEADQVRSYHTLTVLLNIQGAQELSEDEKSRYFAMKQTAVYTHALLHFMLGERLELHHWVLGVRAGGVIVKVTTRDFP